MSECCMSDDVRGLMIAAPKSGSGKTVLTLALLRAMIRTGKMVASAKTGPDYIDPQFHEIACHRPSVNLDPWAMTPERIVQLAFHQAKSTNRLLIESMMGLFDGAMNGRGSSADLAVLLGVSVVLVIDVSGQSQSVAALVRGFRDHRADIHFAGIILNQVGSEKHRAMIEGELEKLDVPVFGWIKKQEALSLPCRHLGLVQAYEQPAMDDFIERAADVIAGSVDISAITDAMCPLKKNTIEQTPGFSAHLTPHPAPHIAPLGQKIALARDAAIFILL